MSLLQSSDLKGQEGTRIAILTVVSRLLFNYSGLGNTNFFQIGQKIAPENLQTSFSNILEKKGRQLFA